MRNKILICAKTYPNLSLSHQEVMCTAGIDENGYWKRLYPINYRSLPKHQKFKKYQWIIYNSWRDKSDPRVESYKISHDFMLGEIVDTKNSWIKRKNIIDKAVIYYNIKDIINETKAGKSIFTFKPHKIIDCIVRSDYTNDISKKYEISLNNGGINLIKQMPYKVYYRFKDYYQNVSTLQIIDWELYQLLNKLLIKYKDNESKVAEIIMNQYYYNIALKKDIYLFLGTNKYWHIRKSRNPLMIIGVFYPPY